MRDHLENIIELPLLSDSAAGYASPPVATRISKGEPRISEGDRFCLSLAGAMCPPFAFVVGFIALLIDETGVHGARASCLLGASLGGVIAWVVIALAAASS
ncbi:MAG: hypothetical protein QOD06_1840 [Candidatus Binatota bacterium]|nr:hypothetical protein [Candidatus Binatota bacterium]